MTIEKRNEIAELVLYLGWYRYKDQTYDYDSIRSDIAEGMDVIIGHRFLHRVYLIVYGSTFPQMRRYNISVLLFGLKMNQELDFILNHLFDGDLKEFEEFVVPILQRIGLIYNFNGIHEFDDNVHETILFGLGIEIYSNDSKNDYFIELFSQLHCDFSMPYWLNDPKLLVGESSRFGGMVRQILTFFIGLWINDAHSIVGTQFAYSPLLLDSFKQKIENLGYTFSYCIEDVGSILNLYVYFHFKKEIIFLFSLLTDFNLKENFNVRRLFLKRGISFLKSFVGGLDLNQFSYQRTQAIDLFEDQYLENLITPIVRIEINPDIELVSLEEFSKRYFWEMPDL